MAQNSTQTETQHKNARNVLAVGIIVVSTLALVAIGLTVTSGSADARFAFPINNASGIEDQAVLNTTSNSVMVFGRTSCTAGQIVEVNVNVTQDATGAVATDKTAAYCLGEKFVQPWIAIAQLHGDTEFEPGGAHVDVWARTQVNGETTDRIAWNRSVTLAETYPNATGNG